MVLNLGRDTLLVELVLMNTPSISQSRRVEDANLRERSYLFIISTDTSTYHYAIITCKFVDTGRVGLTLAAGTSLLVLLVEDVEVVAIKGITNKDIGDEF